MEDLSPFLRGFAAFAVLVLVAKNNLGPTGLGQSEFGKGLAGIEMKITIERKDGRRLRTEATVMKSIVRAVIIVVVPELLEPETHETEVLLSQVEGDLVVIRHHPPFGEERGTIGKFLRESKIRQPAGEAAPHPLMLLKLLCVAADRHPTHRRRGGELHHLLRGEINLLPNDPLIDPRAEQRHLIP